jgi:hypothetical protein
LSDITINISAIIIDNLFIILYIFWFNESKILPDSEENLKMEIFNKNLRIMERWPFLTRLTVYMSALLHEYYQCRCN